jgi:hypothetical protein
MANKRRAWEDCRTAVTGATIIGTCARCGKEVTSDQPTYCPSKIGLMPGTLGPGLFDSINCLYSYTSDNSGGTAGPIATMIRLALQRTYRGAAVRYIPPPREVDEEELLNNSSDLYHGVYPVAMQG